MTILFVAVIIVIILVLRPGVAAQAEQVESVLVSPCHIIGICDECGAPALIELLETDEELCGDCAVEREVWR